MPRVTVPASPGIQPIGDIEPRSSRPRRSVAPVPGSLTEPDLRSRSSTGQLPDLQEDREGEREDREREDVFADENDEVMATAGPVQLGDETDALGRDVFSFGFRTPKKMGMGMKERVAESMTRTPLSQRNTPTSGQRRSRAEPCFTPTKSGAATPVKGILRTPTSQGKHRMEPDTPASTRKRVKKTLIRIAEETETRVISGSESEEEGEGEGGSQSEEEAGPVLKGPPATPRTPARRGRRGVAARELDTANMAESYFEAQATKVLTSDRTLAKLATPRLSATEVASLIGDGEVQYGAEIKELLADHAVQFAKWHSLLHRGYNIVTYGLGSKKSLLHDFHSAHLADCDTVVVNGFFPSLTIKSVLSHIAEDVLEMEAPAAGPAELLAEVLAAMDEEDEHVYLIVHNIDGVMLRGEKCQEALAALAGHPRIHLVCSIDHINAPLIWDQRRLSKLNFVWFDCTTFLPYCEETGSDSSLMTRQSGGLQLASLASVWASLTPNAKKVFLTVVRYQLEHSEAADYAGISFMELYRLCRAEFLVASDLALRAQLTEFRDHKLVISRRSATDGGEYLSIPLDRGTMTAFLENIDEAA